MQKHPYVSIYIITYLNTAERGEVLRKTCEWVLRQNYPNFEVVVSDNGSPYSAVDALSGINDPRLKVCVNEENVGFTGNINRCLEHCSYDIIKPLCDDDLIHKDFLSITVPYVDDDSLVVVDVENFVFGNEPQCVKETVVDPPGIERRKAGYGKDMWDLSYHDSCIPSATLFTRKLFRDLGGFNHDTLLSDWDFLASACLEKSIVHVGFPLCYVGVWEEAETFVKLRDEPYFFAHEGLYTKFRTLHCCGLGTTRWLWLWMHISREVLLNCLIPIKHPFSHVHHTGCARYVGRYFQLLFSGKSSFRPMGQATEGACE
jgi:glycosyltransferase involved in cell wall biosynthesis